MLFTVRCLLSMLYSRQVCRNSLIYYKLTGQVKIAHKSIAFTNILIKICKTKTSALIFVMKYLHLCLYLPHAMFSISPNTQFQNCLNCFALHLYALTRKMNAHNFSVFCLCSSRLRLRCWHISMRLSWNKLVCWRLVFD